MKNMTLFRAAKACEGRLCGAFDPDTELGRVVIDSRTVQPGDFFVAYRGEKADGHDYIAAAFDRGAACCLAERIPEGETRPVLLVEDVQTALERIAADYRASLDLPLVGITGSVGKTTAKEMIASVLEQRFRVLKTETNLNNHFPHRAGAPGRSGGDGHFRLRRDAGAREDRQAHRRRFHHDRPRASGVSA